jgi:NAD(P)-dependent dehydrogenase (short-subunit alcohol dehydrogenase family)
MQGVNVRSVFLCYKAAAIQMIKQGRGGRIIGWILYILMLQAPDSLK